MNVRQNIAIPADVDRNWHNGPNWDFDIDGTYSFIQPFLFSFFSSI